MCLNEKRVLTIPSRKAYGTFTPTKRSSIPPPNMHLKPQAPVDLVVSSRLTPLSSSTSSLSGYSPRVATSCSRPLLQAYVRTSVP